MTKTFNKTGKFAYARLVEFFNFSINFDQVINEFDSKYKNNS